jgi:uncharacterized integral membrane protein (TIGR00697 family)
MTDVDGRLTPLLALVGVFVTCLMTAQVISAKIVALSLPLVGAITFPAGTLAYAGTFYATDCLSELYGKRIARTVVRVGFVMNFVLLTLVYLAIVAPVAASNQLPQAQFARVLGAAPSIVTGSLVAYLVSQHWDVFAFHRLREATDERYLWLRNVVSTGSSQLLDTVVFTLVAFAVIPSVSGFGVTLEPPALVATIVGQYLFKMLIALGDTPLVYATVAYIRGDGDGTTTPIADFGS